MNMPRKKDNGLRDNFRYRDQQAFITKVAKSIGCTAFRPNYHGLERDGNTVLLYLPEDEEHNRMVDQQPTQYSSRDEAKMYGCFDERYIYRPYFWSFENTDVNGQLSLEWANHGTIDMRYGTGWQERIEGAIKLAYYNKMQIKYVASRGGWLGVKEADDTFNDLNLKRLEAFTKKNGRCLYGSINGWKPNDPVFTEYKVGEKLNCFACDFAVAKEDAELREMIEAWRGDQKLPKSGKNVEQITDRVEKIGGELFTWY